MSVGLGLGLAFVRLFRCIILCVFCFSLDYFVESYVVCFCCVKAKFHYACWFEAGSKLVTDQLGDQLRTSNQLA